MVTVFLSPALRLTRRNPLRVFTGVLSSPGRLTYTCTTSSASTLLLFLSFTLMLTLSPSESTVLESIMPQLTTVGFDISALGGGAFSVLATPSGTEGLATSDLVTSILNDAIGGQADAAGTVNHIVACALARKVAMPVGQALQPNEMAQLVEDLFTCTTPILTPDGAATLTIIHPENLF